MLRHGLRRIQPDTQTSPWNKATAWVSGVLRSRRTLSKSLRGSCNHRLSSSRGAFFRCGAFNGVADRGNSNITPREGVWDLRGNSFHQACKIDRWCVHRR